MARPCRSRLTMASRITVSIAASFQYASCHAPIGFVYRHTAAGPPTTGLYAHYDLSTELGKGSFATVMKAISRATGKWYAVKMIHDKSVRSPGETPHGTNSRRAAFAREISIMENLRHPNICELKEVFYQEDSNDISAYKYGNRSIHNSFYLQVWS